MIDVDRALVAWLLLPQLGAKFNQVPVLLQQYFVPGGVFPNDTPNRVYTGHLVPGFDIKYGPGIMIRVGSGTTAGSGGGAADPELPLIRPRMQMTVFADVNRYQIARQIYRAAYDWMHRADHIDLGLDSDGNNVGFILSSLEQVEGQDVDDPHTSMATNISFWGLAMREN